jgi:hypothetical protein
VLRAAPAWGAGLLWGAFVPAAIFAACLATPSFFPLALGVTIAHTVVLGLPVALLFLWRRWTALPAVLAAGLVIGLIPISIVASPPRLDEIKNILMLAGAFGALGATGAGTFWLVLRACGALSPDGPQMLRVGIILAVLGFCVDAGGFVFL